MRAWIIGGAAVIVAGGAGPALAQQAPASPPAMPKGYLTVMPDPAAILRPAPQDGDARDLEDKRIFEASRKLEGSARWKMAQADVPYGIADQMGGFSCAVGVNLTPQTAPRLAAIIARTSMDVGRLNTAAKNVYGRTRPYARWGGTICTPAGPMLDKSLDYPSGHAQLGWANALVLAELAPDRATQILARGRAYADSRAVCGVHTVSATEAGMTLASAQIAASRANPAFKADLDAARAELEALRSSGARPEAAPCATEPDLNKSPF